MHIQIGDNTHLLQDFIASDLNALTTLEKEVYLFLADWMSSEETMFFKTSGSTGSQKKIAIKKKYLQASAKRTLAYFEIIDGTILNCLSLQHIGGAMQLIRALERKLNFIVLEPRKNPFENHVIPWQNISLLSLVPYQLSSLLYIHSNELKKVKTILLGGSEVNPLLKKSIEVHDLKNCYETYGMTETISHIAIKHLNYSEYFTALDGVSIQNNTLNQLIVSDIHLSIKELVTNDIIELISENIFLWKGRIDNAINSGGKKIHPEEVENKLSKLIPYPFFIFGVPNEELGSCVCILIESKTPIDLSKLKENILQNNVLEPYEIPKKAYYIDEFVYTENKKIKRLESIQKSIP